MVPKVNFQHVRWALEELSDELEQHRLWLSDGGGGKDVSSLVEARCGLFDDSGLGDAIDKDQDVLGEPADGMFVRLDGLLRRIDADRQPGEIIADPLMVEVRSLAAKLIGHIPD